jgi:uncharacterized repeat protein (TIGR01451 family)
MAIKKWMGRLVNGCLARGLGAALLLGMLPVTGALAGSADMQISAYTWTPDPVINSGAATFSVTVQNNGPDPSTGGSLLIHLADNVSYVSDPQGCTYNAGVSPKTLSCAVGALGIAQSTSLSYSVTGLPADVQSTDATISDSTAGNSDPNAGNNTLTKLITTIAGADLQIPVHTGPGGCAPGSCSANAGDVVSFTLTPHNAGPDPIAQFRVTDNLPAGADFTYQSASGSSWSCGVAGTTVTCNYTGAALASGADAPAITITGRIITSAGTITNGAAIVSTDSQVGDPNQGNNTAPNVTVTVNNATDLRANKSMTGSLGGATFLSGEAVTLRLSATNTGVRNATGVVLSDTVPADFSVGAPPVGCSALGQAITCNVGNLNAGVTSANYDIPLTAASVGAATNGNNTATISRTSPVPGNNQSATVNYTITPPYAHLVLAKTKTGGPILADSDLTSTITVTNSGSSTAAATGTVTVVDTLTDYPSETYVSTAAPWSCVDTTASDKKLTCTYAIPASIAIGANLPNLVITTHVAPGFVGGTLSNTATHLNTHTPADNNPSSSPTASVYGTTQQADLGIVKAVDLAVVTTGDNTVTYTLTITNHGPDLAATVNVSDPLPIYISNAIGTTGGTVSASGGLGVGESCSGIASTVTCTLKNLANGASRSITIAATRPFTSGGPFTNTATVSSPDTVDPVAGNNSAQATVTSVATISDVAVTALAAALDPVKAGVAEQFTVSIKNLGANPAAGVVVEIPIDPALVSVSGSITLTGSGGSCVAGQTLTKQVWAAGGALTTGIRCTGFTLAANESRQVIYSVIPLYPYNAGVDGPYTAEAEISTTTFESNAGNNYDAKQVVVNNALLDLAVTKQEALGYNPDGLHPNQIYDPVAYGDDIVYRVTLRNNGPSLGSKVQVVDSPSAPGGYTATYVSTALDAANGNYTPTNGVSCAADTPAAGQVTCYLGTAVDHSDSLLPANSYVAINLTFHTGGGATPASSLTYSNGAMVSSAETVAGLDSLTLNNSVTETTTVLPKTDLYVTKAVSKPTVDLNEPFTYTLTVGNKGTSDAIGIRVSDTLPAGFVMTGAVSVAHGVNVTSLTTNNCTAPAVGSGGALSCDLGTIPADAGGADATKQVTISIPMRAAYQASGSYNFSFNSDIANTASVAPLTNTSVDPTPGNNSSSVNVQVRKNSIAGTVYADNDQNDLIGGAEGINAITLTLSGTDSYGYTYGSGQTYAALTATSNATGVYTFDKLPPGTWQIVETQPAGYWDRYETAGSAGGTAPANTCDGSTNCAASAAANTISAITLPALSATAATGYVFQEWQKAQLSGYVYQDTNNDGDRAGAAGIANLANAITLSGTAYNGLDVCTLVTCTVSLNASGKYTYANLPPSDGAGYTVTENAQPTGYYDGKEQAGSGVGNVIALSAGRQPFGTAGNSNTEAIPGITLTPNQTKTEHNFAELLPASLAGYVFIDGNGNAARDGGETSGVTGVTVTLSGSDDLGNPVGPTATSTGANGAYSFTGLRPGSYTVTETAPAGMSHSGAQAGANGGTINGVVRAANVGVVGAFTDIATIPLASNDSAGGYNFGETGPGLSGYVYIDLDRNGHKGAGEPGIAGVQVTLSGHASDSTDVCVKISPNPCTVSTDVNGAYSFPNLPASDGTGYSLTEQSQAVAPLTNYADGSEELGSGLVTPGTANNDNFSGIVLPVAGAGSGYNFGEWAGSLSGRVYHDADDNGAYNGADIGLAGVTVTLTGTPAFGAALNQSTVTAADGSYSFTGLPASNGGGFTLTETQPVDYANRTTAAGTPAGSGTTGTAISGIVLGGGVDGTGYLFGERTDTLSGYVYADTSNDGVKDGGENGISGVTVTLSGSTASGADVCTTIPSCVAVTAADGSYVFTGIRNAGAGGYTVTETQPGAYLDGHETAGSQGGTAPNSGYDATAANNRISAIHFSATTAAGNNNFADLAPASIAGTVYLDANDNGVQDAGDRVLAGVAIALTGTDDTGAAVSANTSTAADGSWSFSGLRPGTYVVTETQPVDFLERTNNVGSVGGAAGLSGSNSQFTGIVASSGTTATGYRFGEKGAGITGFVYLDLNNDGVKNVGENPIPNVTLTLSGTTLSGADVCTLTTCTVVSAGDGSYRFNALPNAGVGGYTITETQPAYQDGKETAGSQGGTVDNGSFTNNPAQNRISAIPFDTHSDATGNNFGEIGNGRISGIVYWDVNADGLRQTSDVLLQNVTITLTGTDTFGDPIAPRTTTTDVNGNFSFTLLRPGSYTLTETQPVDYAEGTNRLGIGTGTLGHDGAGNSQISSITIGGTDKADGYLFGEIANSVSGHVYVDANNDSVRDVGEAALAGVTVTLTGTTASGSAVNQSTATAADGSYSFDSVKNGNYTLTETQPAAYLDGRETAGSQGGSVDNGSFTNNAAQNRISGITFNAATTATGNDFGERATIDLSLNKTVDNATPSVGSSVTFTVTVNNAGPSAASGVVVTDLLPAGYSYVSATPSQGSYVSGTGLWTVGGLTNGGNASLSIVATVNATGPYANTAEVTAADQTDTDSTPNNHNPAEDDQKTVTPVPTPVIDLSLNKTVDNVAPNVGANVTFTVTVANAGPSAATGVVVTDLLPAGYSYISATPSQGGYVSGTGLWAVGGLTNGGNASLSIVAKVNASGPYANTAEVTAADQPDSDSTPNNHNPAEDDQKTVTPVPNAVIDLSLNKTVDHATPVVGSNVTFTVTVANAGPSAASGVVVTDLLPAGYSYVSATPSQGGYVSGTGLWTVGGLTNGGSASLSIVAKVNATGPYANTAEVTAADQPDSDSTPNNHNPAEDDQKTVTPVPTPLIDLSLNKTASNMAPAAGSSLTFTVSVNNAGPSTATGVVVKDLLLAGYSFVSATPSQGAYVSGTGLWSVGSLANGATATLSINVTVNAAGSYSNTAEVTAADQPDVDSTPNNHLDSEDDQKTITPTTAPLIDLSLNKTVDNATPNVGSNVTFTVTVNNAGPSNATGVVVTDALPAGYSFVSASSSQGGYSNATGLWSVGGIANGASASLSIVATVNATGPWANTAEVTAADQTDSDSTPNNHNLAEDDQKTVTPVPVPVIDLSLNKTVNNATPNVGSNVTFTVTVNNAGPSAASGVVVTDQLPAGYSFVSATPSQGAYVSGSGLWTVGGLANGGSASLSIVATVNASGPYANTAEVTAADQSDSDSTPNNHNPAEDDQKTVTPAPTPVIDLSLNKTVDNATPGVGTNVTFTVTVANAGPSAATGVVVSDSLPAGYSFVSATPSQGGYSNATGLWTVGGIANGSNASLSIVAKVNASGPYANTAEVTAADQSDSDSTPNNHNPAEDDQKTVTPAPSSVIDLSLNKTVDNAAPNVGSNVTFTVTVNNAGPSAASGVVVTDQLPAGYSFVSATTSQGSYTSGTGLWTVGGINNGGSASLSIVATVNASGPYANTAEVTAADQADSDSTPNNHNPAEDDQKTVTPVPTPVIDISLNKIVDNATPNVGANVTFTVTVNNAGPSAASGVVVTDALPAGYSFVSATTSQGGYISGTGLWTVGGLTNGGNASLSIVAKVNASGPYANTAEVTAADQSDPDSTPNNHNPAEDDQKTVTPTPNALADLSLTKAVNNATPDVGGNVSFTVTLANAGPSPATGVVVTDALPAGYSFVSATSSQGGYSSATGLWNVGGLANGGSATLALVATVNATGPYLNTAEVTASDQPDPDSTPNNHAPGEDDQASVSTTPRAVADLSLNKTVNNTTPNVGSNITFTVTVSNAGPSNATGVVVSDALPAGYTFVSATPGQGGYTSATGLWNLGALAKDATATLSIVATVNAAGAYTNTAEITAADQFDPDSTPNNHNPAEDDQKTVSVTPQAVADLSLDKAVDNLNPSIGGNLTFTVTVNNAGPSAATGVVVTDPLPAGYSFVSATPSQGGYVNASGLWTVGGIANGGSASLSIVATVLPGGPWANTAEITAAGQPDPDSTPNNHNPAEDDQKTVTPVPRAAISGQVWLDTNNDGVVDAGETGLAGVTLNLSGYSYGADGIDNIGGGDDIAVSASTSSDANGNYRFDNLARGRYIVTEPVQPATSINGKTVASIGATATPVTTLPSAISSIVLNGANSDGNRFGELRAASLSGKVYDDSNGNGAFDAGEPGIPGVSLHLSGIDDLGAAVSVDLVTAADGSWSFPGLRPGSYSVVETQPVDYAEGGNSVGTAGGVADLVAGNSRISGITLTPGATATGYLFGEKSNVISGQVYVDANNNGVPDAGETGIANVTLSLSGSSASGAALNLVTTTDANGNYRYSGVKNAGAGGYTITEAQPAGYLDGRETAGSQGGTVDNSSFSGIAAQNRIAAIPFVATSTASGNDFGEIQAASISGKVWHDFAFGAKPLNGVQDPDEPGLAGVSISLTGSDDLGHAVSATTTTDADGKYHFANLRPGSYQIRETQPVGINDFPGAGGTLVGTVNGVVDGTAALDVISSIVLASGNQAVNDDFREDAALLIGGHVYLDVNGSHGRDAGDTGIAGVTLTLSTGDGACADSATTCTTTSAADGSYLFAGLRAGTYAITETQPPILGDADETVGTVSGVANGAADNSAYDATPQHNRITGIALGAGLAGSGYDFGDLKGVFATVAGAVWINTSSNAGATRAVFDPGDTPMSGWRVELVHGGNVVATATTGADGSYAIHTVTPDYNYSVRFINPGTGQIWGGPVKNDGTTNPEGTAIEVNAETIDNITVPSAGNVTGLDLPIDPSGVVYDSSTGNPVAGVTVSMNCPGIAAGDVIGNALTQVTDATGVYAFFLKGSAPPGVFTCTFSVTGPSGLYLPGLSSRIPVCTNTLTVDSPLLGAPDPALVQDNVAAPDAAQRTAWNTSVACATNTSDGSFVSGSTSARYYDTLVLRTTVPASANLIDNNLPIDPILGGVIQVSKTTPLINVSRGDLVPYTITASNTSALALAGIDLDDLIPPGFKYRSGTASFDEDCDGPLPPTALEPIVHGRALTWPGHAYAATGAAGACKRVKLMLVVGSGVGEGQYDNQAWAANGGTGARLSNLAVATVRVVSDPVFDCSDIIGKVFDDQNANGYEDQGEPGIANVRVATVNGLLVTTDHDGRFHVVCAVIPQAQRGSNFIMKLDERTLPSGYRLTTENPRDVRATRGKMVKLNFGATIHRVVRLELSDAAFQPGKTEPTPALAKALEKLPHTLRGKPSVLRLAYRKGADAPDLQRARLRALREGIERRWKETGCCYTLIFEEEFFERATSRKGGAK